MNIEFRYSVDDEVSRVKKTLEKMSWYQGEGYQPVLPEGISSESAEDEIRFAVEREYKEQDFIQTAGMIRSDFDQCLFQYIEALQTYFEYVPKELIIKLTRYGTSGSFQLPHFIVFDIQDRRGVKTIYHEIMHLCIEKECEEHSVSHWQKERIVDLALHSHSFSFLKYDIWYRDYHGAEVDVDPLFTSFFSDRSSFFMALCGRR